MQGSSAFDIQVGGDHYKDCWMQPATFWLINQLPATEGAVLKYMFRWPSKAGVEDLRKARHFVEMMIEGYYIGSWAKPVRRGDWQVTPQEFCQGNELDAITTLVIVNALDFRNAEDLQIALRGIDQLIVGQPAPAKAVNNEKLRAQNALFVAIDCIDDYRTGLERPQPLTDSERQKLLRRMESNLQFLRREARA